MLPKSAALQYHFLVARVRSTSSPLAITLRQSRRSFTGFVACVFFGSQSQAARFARVIGVVVGRSCSIRPVLRTGRSKAFYVSVPVQLGGV